MTFRRLRTKCLLLVQRALLKTVVLSTKYLYEVRARLELEKPKAKSLRTNHALSRDSMAIGLTKSRRHTLSRRLNGHKG
jgi:hypothetical protein